MKSDGPSGGPTGKSFFRCAMTQLKIKRFMTLKEEKEGAQT